MKKIFNLENLVYFTIIAMPSYVVKVSIFEVPTNIFEILAIISISLFFVSNIASKIKRRESKDCYVPIILIIIGLIVSALYNEAYRAGFGIIKSWFIVPLLFSWISFQVLKNKKDMLMAIYSSAFFAAFLSMIYFLLGRVTFDGRLQAFYNSPNFLAMFLAPAIIIGAFFFKENKKIYLGTLSIIMVSFYLTQSYASWIAVFVAIMSLLFVKKDLLKWKTILGLVLIIGISFFLQKGTEKLDKFINPGERSSIASRMMIWSSAIKIGLDNPVIGIGPGNFQNKYLEYQKYFPPYLEWAVPQPHNLFLAFWLQAGLLGVSGFFWIILWWVGKFLRKREKQKEDYICLGILIYIIIHGLVDTTYFKNDLAVVFWLMIFSYQKHPPLRDGCDISGEKYKLNPDSV